jgi:hypothetical protein
MRDRFGRDVGKTTLAVHWAYAHSQELNGMAA